MYVGVMYACKCTCLHVCLPIQACADARGQVSAHPLQWLLQATFSRGEAGRMSSAPGAHGFTRQALGSTCLFLSQALDWRCVALHVLSFLFFLKQEFCTDMRPQVLILGHGALQFQQCGPRPQKVLLACDSKGLQVN